MLQKTYRIVEDAAGYHVRAVFFNENREIVLMDEAPMKLQATTLERLRKDLKNIQASLDAPIIKDTDLPEPDVEAFVSEVLGEDLRGC